MSGYIKAPLGAEFTTTLRGPSSHDIAQPPCGHAAKPACVVHSVLCDDIAAFHTHEAASSGCILANFCERELVTNMTATGEPAGTGRVHGLEVA